MPFRKIWTSIIEYETPRLVKIHNRKLGLVRRMIQLVIILYVGLYALWLQRGYQEFANVESSVTIKIKGVTKSFLDKHSTENEDLYTRVWDEADYVVPPAENGAFFVATNVIITPNQTRGRCPEDYREIGDIICKPDTSQCVVDDEDVGQWRHPYAEHSVHVKPDLRVRRSISVSGNASDDVDDFDPELFENDSIFSTVSQQEEFLSSTPSGLLNESDILTTSEQFSESWPGVEPTTTMTTTHWEFRTTDAPAPTPTLKCRSSDCPQDDVVFKAHGPLTGFCVPTDRPNSSPGTHVCEIESWCPIEIDKLPLGNKRALMGKAEEYTVFIKNSIAFPYFGQQFVRNNLVANNGMPCMFKQDPKTGENNGCQIFKLGEMVAYAGGNFSHAAIKGGVVSMSITWNCNLDFDFMETCLPKYNFRILDDFGWNFREAKYHEENRRTLYKMYGIKFILTVEGRGGKFNLKNTILNIGSGLALLGVSTVICDFLLMYIKEKGVIKQKKYDYINIKKWKKKTPATATPAQEEEEINMNPTNGCSHSRSADSQVTRTTTANSHMGPIL